MSEMSISVTQEEQVLHVLRDLGNGRGREGDWPLCR
jgi:hypothetical protein